jgi:hypothetical protein
MPKHSRQQLRSLSRGGVPQILQRFSITGSGITSMIAFGGRFSLASISRKCSTLAKYRSARRGIRLACRSRIEIRSTPSSVKSWHFGHLSTFAASNASVQMLHFLLIRNLDDFINCGLRSAP